MIVCCVECAGALVQCVSKTKFYRCVEDARPCDSFGVAYKGGGAAAAVKENIEGGIFAKDDRELRSCLG